MKYFSTLVLSLMLIITSCKQNSSVDDFIKQEAKKSITTEKQLIGQFTNCKLTEVYFVEGFDKNKKLKERFIVYSKDGQYLINNGFIFWGSQKHPVLYSHQTDNIETQTDLVLLKITFSNNVFNFNNIELQKLNVEIQKKIENGTVSEEDISEAGGSASFIFQQYLDETNCGK